MRVEAAGHGLTTDDTLTREDMADEFLLMGLRLAEGIDIARFQALAGRSLDPARIAMLHEHGLVETTPTDGCASPCPAFPCWTRLLPIWRPKAVFLVVFRIQVGNPDSHL